MDPESAARLSSVPFGIIIVTFLVVSLRGSLQLRRAVRSMNARDRARFEAGRREAGHDGSLHTNFGSPVFVSILFGLMAAFGSAEVGVMPLLAATVGLACAGVFWLGALAAARLAQPPAAAPQAHGSGEPEPGEFDRLGRTAAMIPTSELMRLAASLKYVDPPHVDPPRF